MLRLEIYQETAHFRIATIGMPYLSYPLPPPSTVFGFLRAITDYESINYQNTKLSIQGVYKSSSLEKEQLILQTKKEIKTNIISIQKLHQCKWIIHVKSPFEEKIKNAIQNSSKILRLGRKEDLIIDINLYDVEEQEFDNLKIFPKTEIEGIKLKTYKNWNKDEYTRGSLFKMALDTIVNEEEEIIGYKPINLVYIDINSMKNNIKIGDGEYLIQWIRI